MQKRTSYEANVTAYRSKPHWRHTCSRMDVHLSRYTLGKARVRFSPQIRIQRRLQLLDQVRLVSYTILKLLLFERGFEVSSSVTKSAREEDLTSR